MSATLPERLKALGERATPGPWHLLEAPWLPEGSDTSIIAGSPDPHVGQFVCDFDEWAADDDERNPRAWADAELLVTLRNALPELLAALEDKRRMDWLCDAAGREFEAMLGAQMIGRLREAIDAVTIAAARPTACATKGDGNE